MCLGLIFMLFISMLQKVMIMNCFSEVVCILTYQAK